MLTRPTDHAPGEAVQENLLVLDAGMKRLAGLFGDAPLHWTSPDDPEIPECLRGSTDKNIAEAIIKPVLTVRCGSWASALILTDHNVSPVVLRNPALRSGLRTSWNERWIYWVRITGPISEEALLRNGVELMRSGLIPVADGAAGFTARVDHEGPILELTSIDVDLEVGASGHKLEDHPGVEPRSVSDRPPVGVDPDTHQRNAPNSECANAAYDLRLLFADHVLCDVSANDSRFASELLPSANVGTDFASAWPTGSSQLLGVECRDIGGRHLVAVLFRKQQAFSDFLQNNPGLRDGLTTKWPSVVILWLRIEGHVPRNLNAGPLTWFSQGIIPIAVHEQLLNAFVVQKGPIPLIQFGAIVWDAKTKKGFQADEIAQMFGAPFLPNRRRTSVFNELFCSEILLQQLKVTYDSNQQCFARFDPAVGTSVPLSLENLTRLVTDSLVQISREFPKSFPPSEIRRSRVRHLIWLMETRSATELLSPKQAVEQYFAQAVEACPGASLTSEQLFDGFEKFCFARRLAVCSRAYFDRRAAKRFGPTSHCYGEKGTKRGRSGWRLKLDVVLNPSLQAA